MPIICFSSTSGPWGLFTHDPKLLMSAGPDGRRWAGVLTNAWAGSSKDSN
jgi:hypothetical protein